MARIEKSRQVKRNHHYVWSYYLKSWAEGKDIFYISKKGIIAKDSVKGLAKETDFYKINPLNKNDVELIRRFSKFSPPFLQKEHESQLKHFIQLSNISTFINSSGIDSEELHEIDKVIKHNSLENMHSIYEDLAVEVIASLSRGENAILNDTQNMIAFCSYFGHQISRTKSFKEKSKQAIERNSLLANDFPNELKLLEKNWWFISYMIGINIGISLYESKDRDRHILIKNETGTPFITSDHPIINIHPTVLKKTVTEAPEYSDFYFPLSPRYAYMINHSNTYNELERCIDDETVKKLNRYIYEKSYENVFSCNSKTLEEIKNHKKIQPTQEPSN